MAKYIRRPAVFNKKSEREMRIWNWIAERTNNFKDQNFAAFVREKLEWCMQNEKREVPADYQESSTYQFEEEPVREGWASLV